MLGSILKPGDKVEIKKITNHENSESEKYYLSQLLDIAEENRAKIAMPIEGTRIIPLDVGDRYHLFFYTHNGLYQSKCIVVDRYRNGNIYVAVIRFIADLEKFQRRQFFRLECVMELEARQVKAIENKIVKKLNENDFQSMDEKNKAQEILISMQQDWKVGIAIDISGGGLRFNMDKAFAKGDIIRLRFSLTINGEQFEVVTDARLVFSQEIFNRPGNFENRVEFVNMPMKEREVIIKYVFDEERKRRKRLSQTD